MTASHFLFKFLDLLSWEEYLLFSPMSYNARVFIV